MKIFDQVLAPLSNKQREQVESAYALLEHGAEPVHRQHLPVLDDATARSCLEQLLRRTGRTLVAVDGGVRWTSGYDDAIREELTESGWQPLAEIDRAVLTLVLVHSVAIPRSEEQLHTDAWTSPHPTSAEEILRRSKLPATEARLALSRLAVMGLIRLVRDGGYVPGPQLLRLTPAARERLQDQLILAAAPNHPLASAIRDRQRKKGHPSA